LLHHGADHPAFARGRPANARPYRCESASGKNGDAFAITRIGLDAEAQIPGIDEAAFQKLALGAKQNRPVSKALAGTAIHLNARLL
jgi:organic hydroperoxide reductase OsmC/OhrA